MTVHHTLSLPLHRNPDSWSRRPSGGCPPTMGAWAGHSLCDNAQGSPILSVRADLHFILAILSLCAHTMGHGSRHTPPPGRWCYDTLEMPPRDVRIFERPRPRRERGRGKPVCDPGVRRGATSLSCFGSSLMMTPRRSRDRGGLQHSRERGWADSRLERLRGSRLKNRIRFRIFPQ